MVGKNVERMKERKKGSSKGSLEGVGRDMLYLSLDIERKKKRKKEIK